jgi:microcystin-dependent protein
MAETPFLGELKLLPFDYPPKGWALCNGQFLPINQNQALFSLLGTMYGGNGQTTFALPDLRGRVPIHQGAGFVPGQAGGAESVTLQGSQMPAHTHIVMATNDLGSSGDPSTLAKASQLYGPPTNQTTLRPDTVSNAGGSQPHENRQPFLALSWCVATAGIFPSRT